MSTRVFVSAGPTRRAERIIPSGVKPTVGSIVNGDALEACGFGEFDVWLNGRPAGYHEEVRDGDHIEIRAVDP